MPSPQHETLVEMFRHRPDLAAELLAAMGLVLPAHESARTESGDLPDLAPTEYRADLVVQLVVADEPVAAVIVEVQLRPDEDKRFTWPVYLATLRARLRCPVVLLVICVDARTAAWCAEPIELGTPGSRVTPVVLGPERVPVIDDPAVAAEVPEVAVLSAMAHGAEPGRDKVLDAVVAAIASTDDLHALLYSDLVLAALPAALRHQMEVRMTSAGPRQFQSDFVRRHYGRGWAEGEATGEAKGEAKGEARGHAEAVLEVLDARAIVVGDDARRRITECQDTAQLTVWLRRAVVATSVDELFA